MAGDNEKSSGGHKRDAEKPRIELISAIATFKKARVYTFGAQVYGVDNWRKGIAWSRVIGALLRHTFAYLMGEDKDPETGLSHMAHAACCVDFLLEYEDTHRELDDRFKPFPVGTPATIPVAAPGKVINLCGEHKTPLLSDGGCPYCHAKI